uniref:Uncharacterized protein n=1 Tax=Molossus molossus TaxID=27622 RepID=A0A7J8JX84_MOLMO|nr:hypothetical protein HJG59_007992 [Molossus molossus]
MLNCYQFKMDCYISCNPNDNHKGNTYRKCTKENEKGIKACHCKKNQQNMKDSCKIGKNDKITSRHKDTIDKITIASLSLLVITLNINGLNSTNKRHRVVEWIKNNKIELYAVCKRLTSNIRTYVG